MSEEIFEPPVDFDPSTIKVKLYFDDLKVYYGDAVTTTIKNTCKSVEVDTTIPPECYYVANGKIQVKPSVAPFEKELMFFLNLTAREKGYDDAKSFALRAAYPGPYQAEGTAFAVWMDECWDKLYATPILTTTEEFMASLPKLKLP